MLERMHNAYAQHFKQVLGFDCNHTKFRVLLERKNRTKQTTNEIR